MIFNILPIIKEDSQVCDKLKFNSSINVYVSKMTGLFFIRTDMPLLCFRVFYDKTRANKKFCFYLNSILRLVLNIYTILWIEVIVGRVDQR